MRRSINPRCPLAEECERKKCEWVNHELDCIYYHTNGLEGSSIPDQEEIRQERERQVMRKEEEKRMNEMTVSQEEHGELLQAESERTPDTVALEIKTLKRQAQGVLIGYAIEIGRRLEEAKGLVSHGEWGDWLKRELDYSQSTAQNLMKVFREYGADQQSLFGGVAKSQAFGNLTYSKALKLLAISDEEEREQFIETHDVEHMSTRELDRTIKELDAAKKALAEAEDRERLMKQERDLRESDLQEKIRQAEANAKTSQEDMCLIEAQRDKVAEELTKAKEELAALKAKPVEVAVMEPTQEVLDKIRTEAEAEAADRIKKAEAQMERLDQQRVAAEEALNAAHAKVKELEQEVDQRVEAAHAEHAEDEGRIHELEKKLSVADPDMAEFRIRYAAWQEEYQRMKGVLDRIAQRNMEQGDKLKQAVEAALDNMKGEEEPIC